MQHATQYRVQQMLFAAGVPTAASHATGVCCFGTTGVPTAKAGSPTRPMVQRAPVGLLQRLVQRLQRFSGFSGSACFFFFNNNNKFTVK